jgi:hypothetical protein
MKANVTVITPSFRNPFLDRPSQRALTPSSFGEVVRKFITILFALMGGAGVSRRQSELGHELATFEYAQDPAVAGVVVAAPADAATVTLNGTAMTGHQHRASGTVTFSSVLDADTITVNGVVITAKTSPAGSYQFLRGVSNTADAAAFVACVNALFAATNDAAAANITGLIEGTSAAAVATLYAVAEGTAGNAYTLASSNGGRLAVSGATLANGAAATNNEFDRIGNDKRTARSFCTNLKLSSTAILNQHVLAACRSGIVTCSTVLAGMTVTVDRITLQARTQATDLSNGGARDTTAPDEWFSTANSNTNCGISLANCINNHPRLRERFYAVPSAGAVSVYERPPESTEAPPLSSSDGTALAVTGTSNGLLIDSTHILVQAIRPGPAGNAVTVASSSGTTLAIDGSASRLAGGTSTTVTL